MKQKWAFDVHHRKCRSNGGTNDESNLVRVPTHFHRAFHLLFKNFEAPLIAKVLTEVWIDPEWELVAIKKEK